MIRKANSQRLQGEVQLQSNTSSFLRASPHHSSLDSVQGLLSFVLLLGGEQPIVLVLTASSRQIESLVVRLRGLYLR